MAKYFSLILVIFACATLKSEAANRDSLDDVLYRAKRKDPKTFNRAVCREARVRPALNCGCFEYREEITNRAEWSTLRSMCISHLRGRFGKGRKSCRGRFETGRGFLFGRFRTFFQETREVCVPGPRPPTLVAVGRSGTPASSYDDVESIPASSRLPVSASGKGGTFNGLPSSLSIVSRIEYSDLHASLSDLCMTLGWFTGLSRDAAYSVCCPQ